MRRLASQESVTCFLLCEYNRKEGQTLNDFNG